MAYKNKVLKSLLAAALFAVASVSATVYAADGGDAAQVQKAKMKVVFQVSDNDPQKWNLTLNNVKNFQSALGKDNTVLEIVAYGPGINMLKFDSQVGSRVKDAIDSGVKIVACENTMHAQKLTRDDMLPEIGYVPGGVIEIAQKQMEGYAYIRP
ncbi:MAG: DsrE family protein [Sulfuriferula sp.]|nr:DsrE family protein [Sulfuriferula sp.]